MRAVIQLAIDMGKLICVADPDEAAAHAAFIAADDGPHRHPAVPADHPRGRSSPAHRAPGSCSSRPRSRPRPARVRFDDAVGAGWRLVTLAEPALDADLAAWFAPSVAPRWRSAAVTSRRGRRRHLPPWFGARRRGGVAATGLLLFGTAAGRG